MRKRRNKSSKTTMLLWMIGCIALAMAITNYVYSLSHHGLLPSGATLVFSFGEAEARIFVGKKKRERTAPEHPPEEKHMLPPPRKQILQQQKQKRATSQKADLKKETPRTKNHNLSKAINNNGVGDVQASKKKVPSGPYPPPKVNGQQLQYHKELAKGDVHSIAYLMRLSKEEGHDKERILSLLRDNAGIRVLAQTSYDQLPSWSQVTSMYGDRPRLVGMDQCAAFQADGDLAEKYLAVAGAFNSGTNLLSKMLTRNCVLHKRQAKYGPKQRGIRWQVPYGKHTPPKDEEFRNSHIAAMSDGVNSKQVLPVVAVRNPLFWLRSMCSHHYTSRWPRVFPRGDPNYHCPNLYPLEAEKKKLKELGVEPIREGSETDLAALFDSFNASKTLRKFLYIGIKPSNTKDKGNDGQADQDTHDEEHDETEDENTHDQAHSNTKLSEEDMAYHHFPVRIKYSNFTREHRSLVHFYNEWYQEYLDIDDYPHVMVRMEDLLFFPDEVVPQICACAGGRLVFSNRTHSTQNHIRVVAQSAKAKHTTRFMEEGEEHTGYLDALIKYGNSINRFRGMTPQDLQYARRYLDRNIMEMFGYDIPDIIPTGK